MKSSFLPTTLLVILSLLPLVTYAQTQGADTKQVESRNEQGQVYVVQEGDGLYKLARKFFGSLKGVSKIVKAHNEKAANDDRFEPIDSNIQLVTGQKLWIPIAKVDSQSTIQAIRPVKDQTSVTIDAPPATADRAAQSQKIKDIATQIDNEVNEGLVQQQIKPSDNEVISKADQAIIITVPKSNCEIRIWYNYQVVAINRLNERWQAEGMSLIDRAKRAYTIRHNARVNGRFMMADRFEVATLRDRDNKKYGDPNGPSFEYLVNYHRESGFEGDEIYYRIIESSARTSPVFATECK